jgi:hypothetical protein
MEVSHPAAVPDMIPAFFNDSNRDFFMFSPILLTNLHDSVEFYTRILQSGYDGDVSVMHDKVKHIGNTDQSHPAVDVEHSVLGLCH